MNKKFEKQYSLNDKITHYYFKAFRRTDEKGHNMNNQKEQSFYERRLKQLLSKKQSKSYSFETRSGFHNYKNRVALVNGKLVHKRTASIREY